MSPSRLSNYLAGLIIFFSATQFGLHFWPLSSLVYGIRIDYLAPTLYFLDILIIFYLVLRRLSGSTDLPAQAGLRIYETTTLLLTGLLYSQNPLATLSWSLHFLLYLTFLRRLLDRRPEQSSSRDANGGRSLLIGAINLILTLSLSFQALLSLAQVYLGHSLGGLFYYLGERTLALGSPGIALGSFMDHLVLRAYGTFSHPNVLAGYAVISLLIFIRLQGVSSQARISAAVPFFITTLIIFLTESRSAMISLFGIIIPLYLVKKTKLRTLFFYFLALGFMGLVLGGGLSRQLDISTSERLSLQGVSLSVIRNFPIFGTGAGASISTFPVVAQGVRLLQPDHNSFTLLLSWFGLFGVLALGSDLLRKSRPAAKMFSRTSKIYSETRSDPQDAIRNLFPILPLLLLDHYLLTSPQGLFILIFYLLF